MLTASFVFRQERIAPEKKNAYPLEAKVLLGANLYFYMEGLRLYQVCIAFDNVYTQLLFNMTKARSNPKMHVMRVVSRLRRFRTLESETRVFYSLPFQSKA